jgi:DNA-directed RNA polymerase specialized sigma24 family protein
MATQQAHPPAPPNGRNDVDEQHFPSEIDPDVIRRIRFKGQQLADKYGFAKYDAEDIQQDLLLDYLQRSRSYDPCRCGRRTFARLIVNNCIATVVQARKTSRRGHQARGLSLNEPLDRHDPRSPELAEGIIDPSTDVLAARLNLALDIDRFLARLPATLASLCSSIMTCNTSGEAAAKVGLSRATFYRRLRRVRNEFALGTCRAELRNRKHEDR